MKNTWGQHRFAIFSWGLILIIAIVIYWVARPLVFSISEKADDIQKKTIDNELNEAKIEKISELEEEHKYVISNRDSLEVIFDPGDQVGLIRKLETLASQTGNSITLKVLEDENTNTKSVPTRGVKEKKEEEKGIKEKIKYDKYVTLEIKIRGTYSNFLNFLYKLENTTNYINVISLKSGKIKETKESSDDLPRTDDIFIPKESSALPEEEKTLEKTQEKEILESIITIVAYLKK